MKMNIIKKGAAAIIRSYIIAAFDWEELTQEIGDDKTLDDIVGEGTTTLFIESYDDAEELAGLNTIKGTLMTYFVLAPITAYLMILNNIAKWQISNINKG